MAFASVDLTGSQINVRKTLTGKMPRNVHGSSKFVVKVQLPLGGPGRSCVYDARRTFGMQLVDINPAQHGIAAEELVRNIRGKGYLGQKGYFMARREGKNIRIFATEMVEQPDW